MCKRVLNIYRYMVMNVQMERRVWEQLLLVLLQITSLVLKEIPPIRKEDTLGGRLAPALFQTLIVTWIKANLNVIISTELWDQFLSVLSSLTRWEELIKEWAKTMETLTRVLAKQVYCLDLNDLPLDRLSEQKMKKNRGIRKTIIGALDEKFDKAKSQSERVNDKSSFLAGSVYEDSSSQLTEGRSAGQQVMRTRSGSGDHSHKLHFSEGTGIHRSVSDNCLFKGSVHLKGQGTVYLPAQKQVFITGASPSVDEEFSKIVPPFEECKDRVKKMYSRHKSKSLDYLAYRAESPCFSESSECRSRSPSPTPSSGLENTSVKDSPMQIDTVVSSTDNSCNNSEYYDVQRMECFEILASRKEIGASNSVEARSVMSGGTTRGWLSDVAVVLWKRMLGALGDINKITDSSIHAQVMKYLVDLSELLIKIRDNLGVTVDSHSTPPPPELLPPLLLLTPWLFQALSLPENYKQGKLLAYQLLCMLILRRHDLPLQKDYLVQFYYALHYGLMSNDQDIMNIIVKSCGPKFFSIGLPGSTLLIMDFIYAADTVVSSSDVKGVPRTEAMSILGALLCLTNVYKEIHTLQPSSTELFTIACKDAKDHITSILFKAGKREPAGLARCIAINSIGIYLYEELMNKTNHYRIKEAVTVLLIAVRSSVSHSSKKARNKEFNCKAVARVASDMLLLLCDHAEELQKNYADLIRNVIEVLASTLENLLPNTDVILTESDKKLILSLIHCIGEWCFITKIGSPMSSDQDWVPLLSVFKVLNAAASGKKTDAPQSTQSLTELSTPDVDPNVQIENFEEGTTPTPSVPPRTLQSPEKARSADSSFFRTLQQHDNNAVIRLAAKSLMHHLINHLGHFPMGIGASRLTSLVNEHDDVPTLTGDELSAEVFHAPNIQFFVLNNSSIISFVEIPVLDMPGGGATAGLTTSKSKVRIIIRDLGGKFSWDGTILYGPPDFYLSSSDIDSFSVASSLTVPQGSLSTSSLNISGLSSSLSSHALRHRPKDELPTAENSADDLDNLDDLLQYIGHTSPECVCVPGQALNAAPKLPNEEGREREMEIMNLILNQRNQEQAQFEKYSINSCMSAKGIHPPPPCEVISLFQHCRLLLNQLGFTSWEKRSHFDLLKKNEQLLRELRNLDKQVCRDTHKIAVIYVAPGQEDKNTILSNPGGSQEFEEFVAGLGWEVDLENHAGFLGGLQRNKSTGETAPYYATPFTEVIFHVSTRMSTIEADAIHKKVRHLGNDEVHIVWSEHTRDYRKEIIATEFCDVLIVIYPVGGRLYRIHISRKLGIPFFGPLFNGAIVGHKVLPGLVRATAINANRAKRSLISLYMNYYEERNKSLETIVQNHKDRTTFEHFAASVYAPAPSKPYASSRSSGPPSRADSACSRGVPNLAAALLDAHSKGSAYNSSIRSRTVSQSTAEDMSPHSSPQISLRDRPLSASQSQT
ncbi:Ral GTPase-activating protein subunit alpha-2, partial [Stegodyphus mimosarum]